MNADPPIPDELWGQIPPAAQAAIRALIQRYERRLADLEAQLKQNSTNSSKPPSSDPPSLKRSPPKPPSNNKSVVETCRQHGRGVWDFLTACMAAVAEGRIMPSLLTPQRDVHVA
jgi:anti-sigma-K factor RskA